MKTLFVLASITVILFLAAPNKVEAQKRKVASNSNQSKNVARHGYYIKLFRCYACAVNPRQKKSENAMITLV